MVRLPVPKWESTSASSLVTKERCSTVLRQSAAMVSVADPVDLPLEAMVRLSFPMLMATLFSSLVLKIRLRARASENSLLLTRTMEQVSAFILSKKTE